MALSELRIGYREVGFSGAQYIDCVLISWASPSLHHARRPVASSCLDAMPGREYDTRSCPSLEMSQAESR